MYINKVVFVEMEDVKNLPKHMVAETDYGTTEILNNFISDAKRDWKEYQYQNDLYMFDTYEDFKDYVSNILGTDLYEKLETEEIDFCLVCP